jgi:isocitrate dehydrogenase (NAD+)
MKLGDGLFLNTCRRISEEYKDSGIEFNEMIVDNTLVSIVSSLAICDLVNLSPLG